MKAPPRRFGIKQFSVFVTMNEPGEYGVAHALLRAAFTVL
jgi:hypothetical protein